MKRPAARHPAAFAITLPMLLLVQGAVVIPGYAQKKHLDGFLDITFGSSRTDARTLLLQREGVTLDPVHSNRDNLVLDGGSFAGEAVDFWLLGFVDDQLHTARAVIQPDEDHLLAAYDRLLAFFSAQYGKPDLQFAFFDEPYEAGDGFEIYAIRFGKGHFTALWKFSDGVHENVISLAIDENLYIPIVYQSGALIDRALERQEQNEGAGL